MSQTRRLRILAGMLAILSLAVALAACGGGGGNKPKATATKATTKTATPNRTGTPSAALTATLPAATGQAPPSDTPVATQPSSAQATDTPLASNHTTLDVVMTDFLLTPSVASAPAGTVTFNLRNQGAVPHNLRVIKTSLAPEALPVDNSTFTVVESGLDVVTSQPDIAAGGNAQLTVDLPAGHYVLICNIPSHYQAGSRTAFTVQ